jgi:UDP-N-acetylglucosamine 2-epimerase (non-hydrolysing)
MPEEINRLLTDALASYLFVTEEDAIDNLVREGRPRECIYLVGNVMIDALRQFLPIAQQSRLGEELGLMKDGQCRSFAVLTLHRPSNVDSSEKLERLLNVLEEVAERLPIIFPVHPRTQAMPAKPGQVGLDRFWRYSRGNDGPGRTVSDAA